MLSTTAPSNKNFCVQQVLVGGGLQGVAFGVMFATVKAEVEIEDRIDPLDQFGVSFTTSQKGVVTANTQGTPKDADTGIYSLLANPNLELTVTMVEAGPGAPYSDSYQREWSCTRTNPTNPSNPWEHQGTAPPTASNATAKVSYGQALSCKPKLTPPYLQLDKSVVDPGGIVSGGLPSPNSWTLKASGPKEIAGPGGLSKTPIPIGTYAFPRKPQRTLQKSQVSNQQTTSPLPVTGAAGRVLMALTAVGIGAVAFGLLLVNKKRSRERS